MWPWRRPHIYRRTRPVRPMRPVRLLSVPGPVAIILVPISAKGKGDDRQSDAAAVAHHRYRIALVRIVQVLRIHPTPIAVRQRYIAPGIAVDTTSHRYRRAGTKLRHQRIIACRTGPQIDVFAGKCLLLGNCRDRNAEACDCNQRQQTDADHEHLQWIDNRYCALRERC